MRIDNMKRLFSCFREKNVLQRSVQKRAKAPSIERGNGTNLLKLEVLSHLKKGRAAPGGVKCFTETGKEPLTEISAATAGCGY